MSRASRTVRMSFPTPLRAVITGAGGGLGRAIALELASHGASVVVSDIQAEGAEETAELLRTRGANAEVVPCDVTDRDAVFGLIDETVGRLGGIDLIVNNAGVAVGGPFDETSMEDWNWIVDINLWGVIYGTLAFLPLLQQSAQGHLFNVSSVFGIIAVPGQSAYNAAKFGVRGFTEALRHEMSGTRVHVCCVHPGGIKTNIARDSRGGDPGVSREQRAELFDQLAPTSAESAAEQIVRAMEKRRKRLLIGRDAKYITLMSRLFPVNYLRFIPGLGSIGDRLNSGTT